MCHHCDTSQQPTRNQQCQSEYSDPRIHTLHSPCARHCSSQALIYERWPALYIDLHSSIHVIARERTLAIATRDFENGHCVLQAGITRRLAASWQTYVQGEVVDVGVGRAGGVGYGVGETVWGWGGIAEAGRGVEGFVGEKTKTGHCSWSTTFLTIESHRTILRPGTPAEAAPLCTWSQSERIAGQGRLEDPY